MILNHRRMLILLLFIASVLHLAMLKASTLAPQLRVFTDGHDAIGYLQLATNIITLHKYTFDAITPTAFRMPGYPLLLAVAYVPWQTPLFVQAIQIGASILTALLVYFLGIAIRLTKVNALVGATIVAINPLQIFAATMIYPDMLSVFCVVLATFLLLRAPDSRWSGAAAGLVLVAGIYLKPTLAPIAAVLLGLAGVRWIQPKRSRYMFLGFVLPAVIIVFGLAPWTLRNAAVMGTLIPLTTSTGGDFYGGNNSLADGGDVRDSFVAPDLTEVESNDVYTRQALEWIGAHPGEFVRLLPVKAFRFAWPLSRAMSGYIDVPRYVSAAVLVFVVVFGMLTLVGGAYLVQRKLAWEAITLASPFFVLLFISLATHGGSRYALPGLPALAVLVSAGIEALMLRRNLLSRCSSL